MIVRRQLAHLALVIGLAVSPVLAQSLFFPARSDFESGFSGALGTRVATGDFDGDGNLDAVVALEVGEQSTSNPDEQLSVVTFKGDGRGLFTDATSIPLPLNAYAGDVVTGHFDGDSNLDFAVAVEDIDGSGGAGGNGGVFIFSGNGDLTFSANTPLAGENALASRVALAVGELNNDSQDDLVMVNSASNSFTTFLSPGYTPVNQTLTCTQPVGLDLGTLTDDSSLDLAIL